MNLFGSIPLFSLSAPASTVTPGGASKELTTRKFKFIEYGTSVGNEDEDGQKVTTISCDGRIEGVTLELTHWNGNTTPEKYYADTSTEMALNLPTDLYQDAEILNNHFDTDGVLSVFACLQPALAQQYSDLLKEGAAAGDFGEWSSDRGIKLDSTLEAWCAESPDEEQAYQKALAGLPKLLQDLTDNEGLNHEQWWRPTLDQACADWEALQAGRVSLEQHPDAAGKLVVCREEEGSAWLSSYALHRGLAKRGWDGETTRILRVKTTASEDDLFQYQYQKPGHGWVHKLADRRPIPVCNNADELVAALNNDAGANAWKKGGSSLVSICRTVQPVASTVEQVAALLSELD